MSKPATLQGGSLQNHCLHLKKREARRCWPQPASPLSACSQRLHLSTVEHSGAGRVARKDDTSLHHQCKGSPACTHAHDGQSVTPACTEHTQKTAGCSSDLQLKSQRRARNQQNILIYCNQNSRVAAVKHWSPLKANISAKKGSMQSTMQSYLVRLSMVLLKGKHHLDCLRTCPTLCIRGESNKLQYWLVDEPIPKGWQES